MLSGIIFICVYSFTHIRFGVYSIFHHSKWSPQRKCHATHPFLLGIYVYAVGFSSNSHVVFLLVKMKHLGGFQWLKNPFRFTNMSKNLPTKNNHLKKLLRNERSESRDPKKIHPGNSEDWKNNLQPNLEESWFSLWKKKKNIQKSEWRHVTFQRASWVKFSQPLSASFPHGPRICGKSWWVRNGSFQRTFRGGLARSSPGNPADFFFFKRFAKIPKVWHWTSITSRMASKVVCSHPTQHFWPTVTVENPLDSKNPNQNHPKIQKLTSAKISVSSSPTILP